MPVTSSSEQLFGASNGNHQQASGASPPIESATMLLSVLSEYFLEHWKKASIRTHMSQTMQQLEDNWQSFLKSSWANHWLPEVQYLRKFTLRDIIFFVAIGLLTCSLYTIRNDRKSREQRDKHRKEQEQAKQEKNNERSTEDSPSTYNWWRYKNLPTLDVGALGFSTGSSWERRYQTLAMFSCSLAFVMPGTFLSWAVVAHFGALLPLHVFVWKDYEYVHDYENNEIIGNGEVPIFYQLRTVISALLIWLYLFYAMLIDTSPTSGNRKPWIRDLFPDWWKHACDFLPVVLVKTADLPAFNTITTTDEDGKEVTSETPARYVMGYHPHGIIAVGAFCAFATDGARVIDLSNKEENINDSDNNNTSATFTNSGILNSVKHSTTSGIPLQPSSLSLLDDEPVSTSCSSPTRGFSSVFPHLDRRIVTLPVNFGTPFLREYLLAMGAVTSEKSTFRNYLNRNHKNSRAMVVVVGGAAESMLAYEGHIELVLKHRRGFVREAILADASLVPVLGFGETNLYTLYDDLEGGDGGEKSQKANATKLDALYPTSPISIASAFVSVFQQFAKDTFGVAVPLFTGRSVFFTSLGVMPRRRPVVVVVGKPIPPPTVEELGGPSSSEAFSPKIDRKTDQPLNDHGKVLIEWHSKYVRALEELYDEYKDAPWNSPGKRRQDSMKIVR